MGLAGVRGGGGGDGRWKKEMSIITKLAPKTRLLTGIQVRRQIRRQKKRGRLWPNAPHARAELSYEYVRSKFSSVSHRRHWRSGSSIRGFAV